MVWYIILQPIFSLLFFQIKLDCFFYSKLPHFVCEVEFCSKPKGDYIWNHLLTSLQIPKSHSLLNKLKIRIKAFGAKYLEKQCDSDLKVSISSISSEKSSITSKKKKNPIHEPNHHILCEIAVGLKYPER